MEPVIGLAAILASLDPANQAWEGLDPLVARELLAQSPSRIGPLSKLLAPRAESLMALVGALVNGPDLSPAELAAAFQGLAGLAGSDADRIVDANVTLRSIAAERGIAVVAIAPIADLVEGDPTLVASDGLHPSGKQYAGWVELIAPVVRGLLAGPAASAAP